jgi:hypothetical protein
LENFEKEIEDLLLRKEFYSLKNRLLSINPKKKIIFFIIYLDMHIRS